MIEAVGFEDEGSEFSDETGIAFSFVIALFEDNNGAAPDASVSASYAAAIGDPGFPVLADTERALLTATPHDGTVVPAKCSLTPEMVLLDCLTGHGNEELLAGIEADAAGR